MQLVEKHVISKTDEEDPSQFLGRPKLSGYKDKKEGWKL